MSKSKTRKSGQKSQAEKPAANEQARDDSQGKDSMETGTADITADVAYAFPSKSRCPRCGTLETRQRSTKGRVQYRQCTRAICRWRYQVFGRQI